MKLKQLESMKHDEISAIQKVSYSYASHCGLNGWQERLNLKNREDGLLDEIAKLEQNLNSQENALRIQQEQMKKKLAQSSSNMRNEQETESVKLARVYIFWSVPCPSLLFQNFETWFHMCFLVWS